MNPELVLYLSYFVAVVGGIAIGMVHMYFFAVKPMHKSFIEYKKEADSYQSFLIAHNKELREVCELQGKALEPSVF